MSDVLRTADYPALRRAGSATGAEPSSMAAVRLPPLQTHLGTWPPHRQVQAPPPFPAWAAPSSQTLQEQGAWLNTRGAQGSEGEHPRTAPIRSQGRPPGVAPISQLLLPQSSVPNYTRSAAPSYRDVRFSPSFRSPPTPFHALPPSSAWGIPHPRPEYSSLTRDHPYGGALPTHGSSSVSSQGPVQAFGLGGPGDPASPLANSRYQLRVRQQPLNARACGHGERDRRVIDPPPILQMTLRDYNPDSNDDVAKLRYQFNMVHCTLWSVPHVSAPLSELREVTVVPDPNNNERVSRRLMGTLVANPFVGNDPEMPASASENARIGAFFIFHDLSCRQSGFYRLHFTLMHISPEFSAEVHARSPTVAEAWSDVFTVFNAKEFPGMRASSELVKALKRQGATVSVKKGVEAKAAASRKAKPRRGSESNSEGSVDLTTNRGRGLDSDSAGATCG